MAKLNAFRRRPICMIVDWPAGEHLINQRQCLTPIVVRAYHMSWLRYQLYSLGCRLGLYRRKYDTVSTSWDTTTVGVELSAGAYRLITGLDCPTQGAQLSLIPPARAEELGTDEEVDI